MTSQFVRVSLIAIWAFCNMIIASADENAPSASMKRDIIYAEVGGKKLMLDIHLPTSFKIAKGKRPPLYVWIHGGGWRGGSRRTLRPTKFLNHGFAVASISYRFSNEATFPAQIHDCKAAIRWLRANADQHGYSANWIAVGGSSAGAHLALLLGTSGGVAELEGEVGGNLKYSSRVQAVIDYFGPTDFELRGKTQPERAYTKRSGSFELLGGKDGRIPLKMERFASPVTYVSSDDPPLLVFQGTADTTVLPDQSEQIAKKYAGVGLKVQLVKVEGAGHGGGRFFDGENFERALRFLKKYGPSRVSEPTRQKTVLVAAHRGGYASDVRDRAPENSLANLKLAIQKGYHVYETDIQRTADGVFVVMHDPTIDRETTGMGTVAQMTWAELKTLKKRYRDGSVADEHVTTLKQLLAAGKGRILFKPDLKPGVVNHFADLAALISDLKMTDQVFLRTHFKDADAIREYLENDCPRVEVMFKTKNVAQVKSIIERFEPKTIQINLAKGEVISDEKSKAIRYATGQGVLVETHVYKDTDQWRQLRRLGVRMFHTNDPDKVLRFLKSR